MKEVVVEWVVPRDLPCFGAHFPGKPLLPGALIMDWLVEECQRSTGSIVRKVKAVKFLKAVEPGDCLRVAFQTSPHVERQLIVEVTRDSQLVVKGSLTV